MKITILQQPKNDEDIKFNQKTGRYELTIKCVNENFVNNFKDDGILQKRITLCSRTIYNYIFSVANSYNKSVIDFMLHRTKEGRNFLYDMMFEQMMADLETGYSSTPYMPSVNVSNGQVIDRNILRQDRVCIAAEDIADRSSNYFGFNLLTSVPFDSTSFFIGSTNSSISLFVFCSIVFGTTSSAKTNELQKIHIKHTNIIFFIFIF